MSRMLIGAALVAAAALSACQKKVEETTTNTVTVSTTTVPEAGPVSADMANAPAGANYATGAEVTVPEMKPTGGMTQAVKPGDPAQPSAGMAPVMTPTGNEREPYRPAPAGK